MAFRFNSLEVEGMIHIEPDIYGDERGFLSEIYKFPEFKEQGIDKPMVQVLCSGNKKGVLRGLHYQMDPMAQGKLVSVVEGEVFDVGVDLRIGSPTFGKWAGVKLGADKKNMLYIPEGFAHGFCILSEKAQLIYYCTEVYSKEHERGILWSDPKINIDWPMDNPTLSKKDCQAPPLAEADINFRYRKIER